MQDDRPIGPYRRAMLDDPRQWQRALESFLRLYDFELVAWTEHEPGRLVISAKERASR